MAKIHINIDDKMKREVKIKVSREETTITQVINSLLQEWLKKGNSNVR